MSDTRTERDSMGAVQVPADALYGAQTARAVENFRISGWTMPREFIAALAAIKLSAAEVNRRAGRLKPDIAAAVIEAAMEIVDGKHDRHFPIDVFQTGSGTSTNMNVNEVIANRAMQLAAGKLGGEKIHPNDHVNLCQSSNDAIPSAIHVAAATAMSGRLMPALRKLHAALAGKALQFDAIVKIGRTHLMDAVPVRLGQEFSGYASQVEGARTLLFQALLPLYELPIGGTAVGTGLNAPKGFGQEVCEGLKRYIAGAWHEAHNHFAAQGARDAVVFASGTLKAVAVSLSKIASDIRLLGSGPRCGIGELVLPATQPGSSIMPGKVNPVLCESLIQVCCQVIGCDAAISSAALGGVGGILELNAAMPLMAFNLLTAIRLLACAAEVFADKCIRGLAANAQRCQELIEQSLAMITALAPKIGHDAAAAIAKEACDTGKTVREICREKKLLPEDQLNDLLDPRKQTGD